MVPMKTGKVGGRAVLRSAVLVGILAMGWGANDAVASAYMATGGLTSQPIGHYEFCKANPGECNIHPRDLRPAHLTKAAWNAIVDVNDHVNSAVKPMSDLDVYGKDEVWAYPDRGVGDCEDYVLEKRRDLARAGFSLADLLITVVRKPDGEGHAVLTVRTDKGDFILDNLSQEVKLWTRTPYRYLKRQAEDNTGHWVSIRSGDSMLVSAVK
jgi:predicted transglutaminase-like cysteine proteinase